MTKLDVIHTLAGLGRAFDRAVTRSSGANSEKDQDMQGLAALINDCQQFNPWFVPEFVSLAFRAWSAALAEDKVAQWVSSFAFDPEGGRFRTKTVGLIMAGNIPMAGLHDLLCVLASGHRALVKMSSDDDRLIPAVVHTLTGINPEWGSRVIFADGPMKAFDAIIATGSNNSSRYFEYYFSRYPHIIRKNRNGAAVLSGKESAMQLEGLADDIFSYFGLGCRNVSLLYVPMGYEIGSLFPGFEKYRHLADHHKYRNNYDYQKSIAIINNVDHLDNGFLIMTPAPQLISPLAVLHYRFYSTSAEVRREIDEKKDEIQCVVAGPEDFPETVPFGYGQFPELWAYADGVNTMNFLADLGEKE